MRLVELAGSDGKSSLPGDTYRTFLRFYGFSHILSGAHQHHDGQLDPHALFDNLDRLETEIRREALREALNELLNFQLFAARKRLSRQDSIEIRERRRSQRAVRTVKRR